jgi:hypothetical protein
MTATIVRDPPATGPAIRPAPRREPPFDDELVPVVLGAGPLDRPLPFEDHRGRTRPIPSDRSLAAARLPDPVTWGRRLLVAVIETAGGRRPLQQLGALMSPRVASGLRADFERAARLDRRHWIHAAVVRTVHASTPADGVAEVSASLEIGRRVRAVALRLEVEDGRWRCTRLQLG